MRDVAVTTFFSKHEIDTGYIIFQEEEDILEEDNLGTLHEKLTQRGSRLALPMGLLKYKNQDESVVR